MKNKFDGRYEEMLNNAEKIKEVSDLKDKILSVVGSDKKQSEKVAFVSELLKEYLLDNFYIYTIRESKNSDPEMWIYKEGIYIPCGETYIKEELMNLLGHKFSSSYISATFQKIEVCSYISIDEFFKEGDPYLLPVSNGLLNTKTLELKPFDPEKRFFSKINAMYIEGANCPKIKKFISEVVRKQDIALIQEMFGFCLVRKYFLKKAYMLLGRTDAGKSKLLQLLHNFLSVKNCSSVPLSKLLENNGFDIWRLHGKLANISGDSSHKSISHDDLFKSLVGDDPITADRKFKEAIEFYNYAKILNACNELPKTYTYDNAFWNRWILITFPNQFKIEKEYKSISEKEKKEKNIFLANPNILEEITDISEMNGLLNWALKGLQRLIKKGEFSYNKTAEEVKLEWLSKSNSFEAFFITCMEETTNYDNFETKEIIRNAYKNYCKKNNLKIESDKIIKYCLERDHGAYEAQIQYIDEDGEKMRERVWKGISFNEKYKDFKEVQ